MPQLTPEQLKLIMEQIKVNRERGLKRMRVNDIIEVIDEAVQSWLNPQFELRQMAEEYLPVITGYNSEMIRLFLTKYLRLFRKEKLQRMVEEDFPNPLILDEFRPRKAGGLLKAYGPQCTTHIFSGNVPALPLWSMAAGMILKSATLGKVSSAEPLFPVLFAQTLEKIEPKMAATLAIVWWKGGQAELEEIAFKSSEAVIAYGSMHTIQAVKARVPHDVRFVPHGHKVSFGLITNECLEGTTAWETAHLAAHDVSWFDQQGCLSPHVFYVEKGGKISPRDFARMLAQEMDRFQYKMPRAQLTEVENQAILSFRSKAEFQSYSSQKIELLVSKGDTSWTVLYNEENDTEAFFPLSVLNRVVTVVPLDDLDDLPHKIKGIRTFVQTVGVACGPSKFRSVIRMLGESGVNRICALGKMTEPQPGWHHDGRLHLADLVRWCDVEGSAENMIDRYDPYRD
ncbi:acyl-CoA reductase [Caldalkalibacillus uzonensis]|uniref:acyl-CoA reductase n=1 Tax=Caldalkalibacillus uzonensis TaxID=353224 RepID=UPI0027D8D8E8|nr:acyl-CoA reductase [Caldalkalibacillus uzonensis]